ncbi:MAG: ATPase [Pseudomonadales bacterium]|nr:ATPase [Pseudomonadales bacterium]
MVSDLERVRAFLADNGPFAIAVSGGVDSMTLAVVAHRLDPATEIYHALSPAVPPKATGRVRTYARREQWNLKLIDAGEIDDPDYLSNPANRCYFCKTHLYDAVVGHTALTVASGTNLDDLGDYRPGLTAAREHGVIHPWVESGISKAALREIARELGLDDLSELPAAPCLSSRVTTGVRIDADLLPLVDEAEEALWAALPEHLGIAGIRCRIRPDHVGVEVETAGEWRFDDETLALARTVVTRIFGDRAGYVPVEPYRRGSAFLIDTVEID